MKSDQFIRMFITCLLCTGLSAVLPAQNFEFKFKYGGPNKYVGDIKYDVAYTRGDNSDPVKLKPNDKGNVDLRGAGKGKLIVTFFPKKLDWYWGYHKNDYTLYIRPGCTAAPSVLRRLQNDDIAIKSTDETTRQLEYLIEENGSGELKIGACATKTADSIACDNYLRLAFTVSGLENPAKQACEDAIKAFEARKVAAIGQVKAVKFEHPDAPCLSELNNIIAQYELWEKAKHAPCEQAKKHCKTYLDNYGSSGFFYAEINAINTCKPTPKPTQPPPPEKSSKPKTAPEKSPEEKDFERIRTSSNKDSIQAFIDFWNKNNPGSAFVQQAQTLLSGLLPIEYEEKILPDGRRQFRLLNVTRPRIKDLSLAGGMDINTDNLVSGNTFTVTIGSGEYNVFVKDATGKQTTIRITNEFGAALTPVPSREAWLLRVNGGEKPYSVHLMDAGNPSDTKIWKGRLDSDTLLITLAELQERGYEKSYRVLVKNSVRATSPAEAGMVESRSNDDNDALLDAILFVLLLFIVLSAAYGAYLLVWHQKAQKRKATIYDSFQ
ncbi:MAG: hypothetical protein JNJ90_18795 [Saprospiraceae bacterium]|jgi:hypothetical protein|nr:hypothetical protein [Saprospiraceae bacterium]